MKKILVLGVAMMMLTVVARAQSESISKFISKYQDDESFSEVTISGKMFSMIANLDGDTPEEKATISAISKIRGLKILRKEKTRDARDLYKEAMATVPTNGFEELMSVRDKDTDMKFYTLEKGGKISELVMVLGGSDQFMLLTIFGEIDLKEISKIGKSVNIDGLQNLDKIHNKHDGKDNTRDPKKN
jgi:hypothetical protein